MYILNNAWINEFWYGFLVLIGLVISIIYYVHNKKRAFNKSLFLLGILCLFSVGIYQFQNPSFKNPIELKGLKGIEDDNFGTSPDYLGNAVEKLVDFIRKKFLISPL